jgi:hypothetical protein
MSMNVAKTWASKDPRIYQMFGENNPMSLAAPLKDHKGTKMKNNLSLKKPCHIKFHH